VSERQIQSISCSTNTAEVAIMIYCIAHQVTVRNTSGDWALLVATTHVWNSLLEHITSAPSVADFVSHRKTHPIHISYPPLWMYSTLKF